MRKPLSEKIIVLGVDGMDSSLTKIYMDQGKMPNLKKIIDRGSAREDLRMLGQVPTITPPLWTTLCTGAFPRTHGYTCFNRQSQEDLDMIEYNLDSRLCKAEQLWDVFAEAGKKTLVWHWPGASWPPTSDNPNLHVVDGVQPASINMGVAICDSEKIAVASTEIKEVLYKPRASNATAGGAGCIITDLQLEEDSHNVIKNDSTHSRNIIFEHKDGVEGFMNVKFDLSNSPIKEPTGWKSVPEGAKEFTIVTSNGLSRRPCLILKNKQGQYDTVALYLSKKDEKPYVTIKKGEMSPLILEPIAQENKKFIGSRLYKILDIDPSGSMVKVYISCALDIENDSLWHPKSIYKKVIENVGHVPAVPKAGGDMPDVVEKALIPNWNIYTEWQADALNYLIKAEGYDVIFSHIHSIDAQGHLYWYYAKTRKKLGNDEKIYQKFMEYCYIDIDNYFGKFIHLLDEGWTILIVSDHGLLVSGEDQPPYLGDESGVNLRVMQELGYTHVKTDQDGNELKEIDWERTTALAVRGNHIWINLKGRNKHGIVDPKDKDELERKIIDDLYNYREPVSGKRVISIALRNKDAAILGMDCEESGDILYWLDNGFGRLHGDCLPTCMDYFNTSLYPVFIAAGSGIKKGYKIDRHVKQIDIAPTIAILGGMRMPAQCDGGPIYQIFTEDV